MILKEILNDTSWNDIKDSLVKIYEVTEDNLEGYFNVYCKLISIDPVETGMRIFVDWIEPDGNLNEEGYWVVHGKNGTLIKDTDDAKLFPNSSEEYFNSEVNWALDFSPWNEWLGMKIDESTFNNINLMKSDIVAHCLWEMTFLSYNEEKIQERADDLKRMVDQINNMTEEELKKNTISLEEMEDHIKKLIDKMDNEEKDEENI